MVNLLETIADDDSLARRLASMPTDCETITLSFADNRLNVQHPHWAGDASEGKTEQQQTVDIPADFAALRADEGFVPPRRVVSLAQFAPPSHAGEPKGACAQRTTIDDVEYRLIGKIGGGGTGIVYQAHQRGIDREVAVKVLRHELASERQSRHRFLTEARVIGSLDHPNVIALHDLCIDCDGYLFYSMKRVDGTSWDQQIEEFSVEENLRVLLRVADAIRYAHSRGLIHRDIKPENVMLGQFGEVLLADWGLAIQLNGRARAGGASEPTPQNAAIGGTPAYMAPEQAIGRLDAINASTDVYLLGATLYQILTGQPPHRGENLLACIHAAANNEIQPTEVVGELIDAALTAMASDPSERYATVEDFIHAVTDHRTHQESERLVRRAKRRVWPEERDTPPPAPAPEAVEDVYERFRVGQALLHEAIDLWPENQHATDTLKRVQLEFARFSAGQGDLDISLRLYAVAGQADCEAAVRVRRQRDRRDRMRESQAKYSALFTQSPEAGLLIRWSDGVLMEANTEALEMLGYQLGELVGKPITKLEIWACPKQRTQFLETLTRDRHIENFETQFVRKTASDDESESERTIDVLISSRTVEVNGDQLLLSTIRDITERRSVERDLEQSRRRLRDLQRLAGLGTWSYNAKTQLVHWSEEAFRVAGRDQDRGAPRFDEYLDRIHPEDRDRFQKVVTQAIETGASYQILFRQLDDQGNYRSLMIRGRPVVDEQGNAIEIYGILMATPGTL